MMAFRRSLVTPVATAGLTFALAALAAADADWPQWRGTNRDGVSPETGLLQSWPKEGPPLVWTATGLGTGYSSISIANGRIFTMGDVNRRQMMLAFSEADGTPLWSTPVSTPSYDDQHVGTRTTPTIDGDFVYALGTDGDLVCLEAATGKERWRRNLETDLGGRMMSRWRYAESPLVDGDRVVVTPGGPQSAIVALDKRTGKEIWRAAMPPAMGERGADGAAYSSIVISNGAGVKQYVQLVGRGLVGVRASDGRTLWHYNRVANDVANIPTPIVRGDYVFASTSYQTGAALLQLVKAGDGVEAKEIYFLPPQSLQNHHGGMVLVGDHLYGGHGHRLGFPFSLHFTTGKFNWGPNIRNEGQGSAAVIYADNRLYYRYENGKMLLIEATPEAYRVHGSFDIPDVRPPSWSHPVISRGSLYLREQDTLYRYNVRQTTATANSR
jgi:outer membrane protein assembly factor BamB